MKITFFVNLILSVVILTTICACQSGDKVRIENKKISPWYIYKEGSSFKDIEPVKDLISSISVFGSPNKEFIDECHENDIEVYHAVSGNESLIDTSTKIENIVSGYIKECQTKGYDGIDLDFEHLDPKFQDTYTMFLKTASKRLHEIGKKLSHCVGFYPTLYEDCNAKIFYDPKVLAQTCDIIRVMCYDMYFAPGIGQAEYENRKDLMGIGPTSNFSWTKETMLFWKRYIKPECLVMALPAYGNDYSLTGSIKGRQIDSSVRDSGNGVLPEPRWLYYEKLNTYLYDGMDGNKHLFYASDAKSTEALLELADSLGILNVGFWHFGSVDPDMWKVSRQWVEVNN